MGVLVFECNLWLTLLVGRETLLSSWSCFQFLEPLPPSWRFFFSALLALYADTKVRRLEDGLDLTRKVWKLYALPANRSWNIYLLYHGTLLFPSVVCKCTCSRMVYRNDRLYQYNHNEAHVLVSTPRHLNAYVHNAAPHVSRRWNGKKKVRVRKLSQHCKNPIYEHAQIFCCPVLLPALLLDIPFTVVSSMSWQGTSLQEGRASLILPLLAFMLLV